MKLFLKRRLKADATYVFQEAMEVTKVLLSSYEFSGNPSEEQLKASWERVVNNGVRRDSMYPSFILFQDSCLTVNFIQHKILYPMLENYVPKEVNGKILLMEHCLALLHYDDTEQRTPYRPEAEISVIWDDIGAKVIGEKAFRNQHENKFHTGRFSYIKRPIQEINRTLEQYIFGDINYRAQKDLELRKTLRGG